ncbi:hypothetical protein BDV98DRAFT_115511 [Pterulicium gracile]|uniref:Uncharacterized protein n=1 Tax=Pterulicium gracile TaxID=1884261 RepID=A0A5C3QFC2_9AGAR|nr:hypothetical protein BDV98DRAFT_115511 [Pterula gracilis]
MASIHDLRPKVTPSEDHSCTLMDVPRPRRSEPHLGDHLHNGPHVLDIEPQPSVEDAQKEVIPSSENWLLSSSMFPELSGSVIDHEDRILARKVSLSLSMTRSGPVGASTADESSPAAIAAEQSSISVEEENMKCSEALSAPIHGAIEEAPRTPDKRLSCHLSGHSSLPLVKLLIQSSASIPAEFSGGDDEDEKPAVLNPSSAEVVVPVPALCADIRVRLMMLVWAFMFRFVLHREPIHMPTAPSGLFQASVHTSHHRVVLTLGEDPGKVIAHDTAEPFRGSENMIPIPVRLTGVPMEAHAEALVDSVVEEEEKVASTRDKQSVHGAFTVNTGLFPSRYIPHLQPNSFSLEQQRSHHHHIAHWQVNDQREQGTYINPLSPHDYRTLVLEGPYAYLLSNIASRIQLKPASQGSGRDEAREAAPANIAVVGDAGNNEEVCFMHSAFTVNPSASLHTQAFPRDPLLIFSRTGSRLKRVVCTNDASFTGATDR